MPNAVKRWPLEEHRLLNPQARLVLPAMILACGIGLNGNDPRRGNNQGCDQSGEGVFAAVAARLDFSVENRLKRRSKPSSISGILLITWIPK